MLSTTAFLALAVQCAASIHPSTSLDVARVESGFHPYAIAEILPDSRGVISHFPTSLPEAILLTRQLATQERRYSVGLMQITSTNFRHYGVTASDLLNPCINLSVFERILADCYRRGGTLKRALSCYYSGNFETGQRAYTPELQNKLWWAAYDRGVLLSPANLVALSSPMTTQVVADLAERLTDAILSVSDTK